MNDFFKDFFHFKPKEKKALQFFVAFITILIAVKIIVPEFFRTKISNASGFDKQISDFRNNLHPKENDVYLSRLDKYILERYDSLNLFNFNPNTTTETDFKKLGLTDKQIKTIFTYRNRGGKFVEKDDFRKIYGIRNKQFEILKPYILLPDQAPVTASHDRTNNQKTEGTEKHHENLFPFDPNTVTETDLQLLGFSEKQATVIANYRTKSGGFKTAADFKKIFCVSAEMYTKLEPYIRIKEFAPKEEKTITIPDLNTATVTDLASLKGIGQYTAEKIINYRNLLGGYVNLNQLKEVYGFNINNYETIVPQLTLTTAKVKKIRINFAGFDEFKKHPYLKYNFAKAIIDYRDSHGLIKDLNKLKTDKVLPSDVFDKIAPYLTCE